MSPIETMAEKPMPRGSAQSSTVVAIAPDWVRKAMLPGSTAAGAKVALSPMPGTAMPRQFGPTMRKQMRARGGEQLRGALLADLGLAFGEAGGENDGGARAARGRARRSAARSCRAAWR